MDFSYITDESFRRSLISDHQEMTACLENGSWKSVHVMAGSIVEALLVEYLVVSGIKPNGKDPLKIDLGEAVKACEAAGVLQGASASLCDVVRDYRNLIHPGKLIRTNQEITEDRARIAASLVGVINKEVAEKRKLTYGSTAEQLVKKIQSDEHVMVLLPELIGRTNEYEKKRFVIDVLPAAYDLEDGDPFSSFENLERLRLAYRQVLESLPLDFRTKLAQDFVQLIRDSSSDTISKYGDAYFISEDVGLLDVQDRATVMTYIQNRLNQTSTLSIGFVRIASHLGKFLEGKELDAFADSVVRAFTRQESKNLSNGTLLLRQVFNCLEDDKQEQLGTRAAHWVKFGKDRGYSEAQQKRLSAVAEEWFYIPF